MNIEIVKSQLLAETEREKQISQKEIEEEVDALIEKSRPKGKNRDDFSFDFAELDEVFEMKEMPNVKIDQRDIRKMTNEYQLELEREINEDIERTYKPFFSEEEHRRVEELLRKDEMIGQALSNKAITKEELLMFIDYYEILSTMNRAKRDTLVHMTALNEFFVKDVEGNYKADGLTTLDRLTKEIEGKINASESFLNKSDYQLELNKEKEYIAAQLESKSTVEIEPKADKPDKKANISTDLKQSNSLIHSQERKGKVNSNRLNIPIKNKIELFNDNNQITNLLKVRNDRKEIIKANYKQKGSYRPDLFKFPKLKPLNSIEDNKQLQFVQVFDGPKALLEKARIDPDKKSLIRKKIEDAQKYYMSKK